MRKPGEEGEEGEETQTGRQGISGDISRLGSKLSAPTPASSDVCNF